MRPRWSRLRTSEKENAMSANRKFDVHQEITNRIVNAIEPAGEFRLPWLSNRGSMKRPVNIASGRPYNGVNIVSLWVSALASDHPSHLWGTYRQWQERGCQVRKGHHILFAADGKEFAILDSNGARSWLLPVESGYQAGVKDDICCHGLVSGLWGLAFGGEGGQG